MRDTLTILTATGRRVMTKTWLADGTVKPNDDAKWFTPTKLGASDLRELSSKLVKLAARPASCVVRHALRDTSEDLERIAEIDGYRAGLAPRQAQFYDDTPLHALMLDVDGFVPEDVDPVADPERAAHQFIAQRLPSCFGSVSFHWQLSGRAGHPDKAGQFNAHLWFWLSEPRTSAQLYAWAKSTPGIDAAVYRPVQAHYTADPVFEDGVTDPVPVRCGFVEGFMGDEVDLDLTESQVAAVSTAATRRPARSSDAGVDPVADYLWGIEAGKPGSVLGELHGRLHVLCPWFDNHTGGSGATETVWTQGGVGGVAGGGVNCMHDTHDGQGKLTTSLFLSLIGYTAEEIQDEFDDVTPAPDEVLHVPVGPREGEFVFISPENLYMHRPTKGLWTANAVDKYVGPLPGVEAVRKKVKKDGETVIEVEYVDTDVPASRVIAKGNSAGQLGWAPGRPELIEHTVMTEGGLMSMKGQRVYNLYRQPPKISGDPALAGPWLNHVRRIYPEHFEHLLSWAAHTVQHIDRKINHAIVLGGAPGIGKDTMLSAIRTALGAWNCGDIGPSALAARFNGFVKNKLLVVSEARDSGEISRHAIYEASKTLLATPPDTIRVDEKNLREHHVVNRLSVVVTTNHRTDGLYLPADDRRHYVAWSEAKPEDFDEQYWTQLHTWLEAGGAEHAAAWLLAHDAGEFNPKAPPLKTRDFWLIVQANEPPENAEFRDLIEGLEHKGAFTLGDLVAVAHRLHDADAVATLTDKGQRRALGHKLGRVGFGPVRNPDAKDGLWVLDGRRAAVYCDVELSRSEQITRCRERLVFTCEKLQNTDFD